MEKAGTTAGPEPAPSGTRRERLRALAGATRTESDDVLAPLDSLAPGKLERLGFVDRRDGLELEAVEALHGGELRRLDTPLDEAPFAVDELELGRARKVRIDAGVEPWRALLDPAQHQMRERSALLHRSKQRRK